MISRAPSDVTASATRNAFDTMRWFSLALKYVASTIRNGASFIFRGRVLKASTSSSSFLQSSDTVDFEYEVPHSVSTTFETFPVSLPVYVIESSTIFRIFMKIGQTYYNLTAALRTGKRIKAKIRGLGMELLSDPNISSYEANIVLFRFLTELDSSL